MSDTADFTAWLHPTLAVSCPTCRARPGQWCVRPSEHRASSVHASRGVEADRQFIAQHGPDARIVNLTLDSPAPRPFGRGIWRVEQTEIAPPTQGDLFPARTGVA